MMILSFAKVVTRHLSLLGHLVDAASNGIEALATMDKQNVMMSWSAICKCRAWMVTNCSCVYARINR
jgi:CheY-like chemotaxis protein